MSAPAAPDAPPETDPAADTPEATTEEAAKVEADAPPDPAVLRQRAERAATRAEMVFWLGRVIGWLEDGPLPDADEEEVMAELDVIARATKVGALVYKRRHLVLWRGKDADPMLTNARMARRLGISDVQVVKSLKNGPRGPEVDQVV